MYLTIIILIAICSILLVLVVLAQNPKGGGLSEQFGGAGSSQMMGVKRTTDLLEKLTWGFAIAIITLSIAANMFIPRAEVVEDNVPTSTNLERAKEIPVQQQQQQMQQQSQEQE